MTCFYEISRVYIWQHLHVVIKQSLPFYTETACWSFSTSWGFGEQPNTSLLTQFPCSLSWCFLSPHWQSPCSFLYHTLPATYWTGKSSVRCFVFFFFAGGGGIWKGKLTLFWMPATMRENRHLSKGWLPSPPDSFACLWALLNFNIVRTSTVQGNFNGRKHQVSF